MAVYTAIDDAGSFFNTKLWTGTSATHAITGMGFQPDLIWGKCRDAAGRSHVWTDSVRGTDSQLSSDDAAVPTTYTNTVTAFGADGFTMGADSATGEMNESTDTFVGWNWKAGTTSGITTNGSTTITPSAYSFNQTAGFSVIKYSGNSTGGAKVAHGLGVTPAMVAVKNLGGTDSWMIYHKNSNAVPEDYLLQFNTTGAAIDNATLWNDTAPDSVNVTLGTDNGVNGSYDYIAYCFADVQGYSRMGVYTGNGSADGPFAYTGFRPAWIMIKRVDTTGEWNIWDNKRLGYNPDNSFLQANSQATEAAVDELIILSNGFKLTGTDGDRNASAGTYVYMAFAESPFVNSEGVPTNAR